MRQLKYFAVVLALTIMMSSCATFPGISSDSGKLKVISSVYPMYDFAQKIGGEYAEVTLLVPAGFEPHTWEPTTKDMLSLEKADVFVYNGAGMEMWVDNLLSSIENKNLTVVETSDAVELMASGTYSLDNDDLTGDAFEDHESHPDENHDEDHDEDDHDHGLYDPHVWLSPANAKLQMQAICDAFCLADPEHADAYRENYAKYSLMLDELDTEYHNALDGIDPKYIVVSHEAFGYMCKEYGMLQVPIRGISADAEPDAERMRRIIDFINENHIRVVFFEALTNPKVSETIAAETGCDVRALHPIGGLTQEQIDNRQDYFTLMRDNLTALAASFTTQDES